MGDRPLELETALARLGELARPTPVERVAPQDALKRYAASDVLAQQTRPHADLSAMDGFAVSGQGPWQIVGESRCGAPFGSQIVQGEAVRISTGAVMPPGSVAVVIKEDARLTGDRLSSVEPPVEDKYIRRTGFDFRRGDTVLARGARVGAAQLAILLAAACSGVEVRSKPVVTILQCGDELAGGTAGEDQIPATNGAMLAAMCASEACDLHLPDPLPDRLQAIASAVDAASDSRLVVISGGASAGDHDLVRPALESLGIAIDFWKVAMKPGKPLMVARRGEQLVLGLPGNPVSSFVTGFLFMLPAIRTMLGAGLTAPMRLVLPAGADLPRAGDRREFLRAAIGDGGPVPLDPQDSSALAPLARADCLIDRPAGCEGVKAGTPVPVYLLGNGGNA